MSYSENDDNLERQALEINKKLGEASTAIDETMEALISQAKAQRRYALLEAATAIFTSASTISGENVGLCVSYAEDLLAEIERREHERKP